MRKTPFIYVLQSGIEVHLKFPCKKEVCPRCEGRGKHVNPNVDGNGITAEEWENEWDDDSREAYMSGRYDIMCEECNGQNVVDVIDVCRLTKKQKVYYDLYCKQRRHFERMDHEDRMTRRWESGCYE